MMRQMLLFSRQKDGSGSGDGDGVQVFAGEQVALARG